MILQDYDPLRRDALFRIPFLIIEFLFLIGFILSVRRYRRRKSYNSLILIFLTLQGFLGGIGAIFFAITDMINILPLFSFFGFFIYLTALIIVNIKLEEKLEQKTEEVKQSEKKYQNLVLNIVDVLFEMNSSLILNYVSPQVNELFNVKQHVIIDRPITNFIHQKDLKLANQVFRQAFEEQKQINIECRMQINSDYKYVSIRGGVVKDKSGMKLIGVIRDISDQKKAEKVLREQFEKMKEVDQIRSDLVRRTSHELKTPLISLFSSSKYLMDTYREELDDDILKFLRVINRGGKRLKNLINNMIDAYNIESRGITLDKKEIDIVKSINECVDDLVFSLEDKDLYLKKDLPQDYKIEVDKERIEQVILNLLSNAIKNTPPKGLIYVKLEQKDNILEIMVKDTGIGLIDEEKERLFQKFGKIERNGLEKKVNNEGSGLGLYISKEIVELHGGRIIAESEGRNKGSTFIVRLPIE
ncbi:MAG: putative Histidine kinase [Promethearchaeota archaeon]|nr:MAG: putative Histidine kinase [Candidatus Lokiarchaeota archaeon]